MSTLNKRVEAVESQVVASVVFGEDPHELAQQIGAGEFTCPIRRALWRTCMDLRDRSDALNPLSLRSDWTGSEEVLSEVLSMRDAVARVGDLVAEFRAATGIARLAQLCSDCSGELHGADFTADTASRLAHSLAETALRIGTGIATVEQDLSLQAAAQQLIEDCEAGDTGVSTGIPDLDRRIGGLRPGSFIIPLGRSGHGKSALSGTMAEVAASAGHRVLIVSREMPSTELALRFAAYRLDQPHQTIRAALERGDPGIQEQVRRELRLPIDIDDESRHIDSVCARVMAAKAKDDPYRIVILDFIQLFDADGEAPHQRLEHLAYAAKNLALRAACTVIGVAQPNREGSKAEGTPGMSDIRGSSAIENAADVIISMQRRDAPYLGADYELNLSVEKARNGQPGGLGGEYRLGAGTFRVTQIASESCSSVGALS